jgi:hypothetical protein
VRKNILLSISIPPESPEVSEETFAMSNATECASSFSVKKATTSEFQWVDERQCNIGDGRRGSFAQYVTCVLDEDGRLEFLRSLYFNGEQDCICPSSASTTEDAP